MWTITDENQVTLRQCLICAKYQQCELVAKVIAYHPKWPRPRQPKEWKEGMGLKAAQCTIFEKQRRKDERST